MDKMDIIKIIEEADDFPALPHITFKLTQLMSDPNVSLHSVAKLIETDSSIVIRILKKVNSGYYKLNQEISDIYHAVSILGLRAMREITLMVSFEKLFPQNQLLRYSHLFEHSLTAAVTCNLLSDISGIKKRSDAFIASLLQNLGSFVFMHYLPKEYFKVIQEAKEFGVDLVLAEKNNLKITNAQAGAIIAEKWNLPKTAVLAIRYQYNQKLAKKKFDKDTLSVLQHAYLSGIVANIFLGWNKAIKIAKFRREYNRLFSIYPAFPDADDILSSIPQLVQNLINTMNQNMESLQSFSQIKKDSEFELELFFGKHNRLYNDFFAAGEEYKKLNDQVMQQPKPKVVPEIA